ncbi:MAG: hypothetical protein OXH80_00235 [Nitrospira sp.]|nr:hypothetical protein [Nitrospira sp.]
MPSSFACKRRAAVLILQRQRCHLHLAGRPNARPRKAHFRVVIVAIFTQIACHIFKREFFFSFQMVGKIFEARIGM